MRSHHRKENGQGLVEYSVIIIIVVAVVLIAHDNQDALIAAIKAFYDQVVESLQQNLNRLNHS